MRKTYYYIAGIIIMLAVAITVVFAVVRIYNSEDEDEKVTGYSMDYDNDSENFYLLLKDETVTIYLSDDTIYDYSRLNVSDMPKEIINKLLEGYHIKGKDNLYSFLQAYSS